MTCRARYRRSPSSMCPQTLTTYRLPTPSRSSIRSCTPPCEMTIAGRRRLDFEGASRWGWHTFNAHGGLHLRDLGDDVPDRADPAYHQRRRYYYATAEFQFRPRHRCNLTTAALPCLRPALPVSGWPWRCGAASASPISAAAIWKRSMPATPAPQLAAGRWHQP